MSLENGHWWFEARGEWIISEALGGSAKLANVLDVGCGTGFVLRRLVARLGPTRNMRAVGLDIDFNLYSSVIESDFKIEFRKANLLADDITALGKFDTILCCDVLEHQQDDSRFLSKMSDLLEVSGILIITVPMHRFLWSDTDVMAGHYRRYDWGQLKKVCSSAGFDIIGTAGFGTLLTPLIYLSRRKLKISQSDELSPGRLFNIFMKVLMKVDVLVTRLTQHKFASSGMLILKK